MLSPVNKQSPEYLFLLKNLNTCLLSSVKSEIKSKLELDYFNFHEARYRLVLEQIQRITGRNTLKILDVGCFPFHLGRACQILGHEVFGISSNHEPLQDKNITILDIETEKFPYEDNFFDLILCSEVIEHLPHSSVPPLREMYRVAGPHGYIIITTPNIARSANRVKLLMGRSPQYPIEVFFENEGKGSLLYHRHIREFTMSELIRLAKGAQWTIKKGFFFISYSPFQRYHKTLSNPVQWIGKVGNFLAMNVVPCFKDSMLLIGQK
jgi:2-polyprenyl-3-methyl-5-hydroxy-6-metoxy-1,4-benzoquinol methylase